MNRERSTLGMSRPAHAIGLPSRCHARSLTLRALLILVELSPCLMARSVRSPASDPSGPLRWLAGVLAAAISVGVRWLGSQPAWVGVLGLGWDKAAHAGLHFVLCSLFIVMLTLRRSGLAVAICALLAGLDEWLQINDPHRTASLADWLASVAGAVLACGLLHWLSRRRAAACRNLRSAPIRGA